MSSIYLEVKIIGGTDIAVACNDLIQLARHLDVNIGGVRTKFNGTLIIAHAHDDAKELADEWYKEFNQQNKQQHKNES